MHSSICFLGVLTRSYPSLSSYGLEIIFIDSILSSFVLDFYIRQKVAANINMFYVYQIPLID